MHLFWTIVMSILLIIGIYCCYISNFYVALAIGVLLSVYGRFFIAQGVALGLRYPHMRLGTFARLFFITGYNRL